jgi:hypothetical protein
MWQSESCYGQQFHVCMLKFGGQLLSTLLSTVFSLICPEGAAAGWRFPAAAPSVKLLLTE